MNNHTSYRMLKAFLFLAVFGMLAYLTQAVLPFVFFASLTLMMTLGRAVLLGIVCAVLFGACFPKTAALAALAMTFYVLTRPSRSASTQH
ncbi:MAG: hypothetical protein KF760_27950 [Candidatus Eremiobacteraeota bacterium]|nr:hypothetical protein [Candidatus Eremiobacteraeota bacterium]MCW5869165.1 hypothetical protein [Candidatus Eremiobacteraeota bacterium]